MTDPGTTPPREEEVAEFWSVDWNLWQKLPEELRQRMAAWMPPAEPAEERWTLHRCEDCGYMEGESPQGGCCPKCGNRKQKKSK
jgi:rubrerythrin